MQGLICSRRTPAWSVSGLPAYMYLLLLPLSWIVATAAAGPALLVGILGDLVFHHATPALSRPRGGVWGRVSPPPYTSTMACSSSSLIIIGVLICSRKAVRRRRRHSRRRGKSLHPFLLCPPNWIRYLCVWGSGMMGGHTRALAIRQHFRPTRSCCCDEALLSCLLVEGE